MSNNLDRKEIFNKADGGNLIAKVPLSWQKSINLGVVIPHESRNCTICKKDIQCDICDKLVNQKKRIVRKF